MRLTEKDGKEEGILGSIYDSRLDEALGFEGRPTRNISLVAYE
jgi:hypothetical protein